MDGRRRRPADRKTVMVDPASIAVVANDYQGGAEPVASYA